MKRSYYSIRLAVILMLCIICLFETPGYSQAVFEKQFTHPAKLKLGQSIDLPGGDKLFTATATSASFDSSMALLIKTDSMYQIKWTKRYKALHKDNFISLLALSDGNVLVGGAIRQDFSNNSGGSVFKMDTAGNVLWHKNFPDSYDDGTMNMFEQADSSLMLFIRYGVYNYPVKIVHTDKNGNVLAARELYNGNLALFAYEVVADHTGNYYLTGTFANSTTNTNNLYICKINQNGVNWCREYIFGRSVTSAGIVLLDNGNLGITGHITDSLFPNSSNLWAGCINPNGDIIQLEEIFQVQSFSEYCIRSFATPNAGIMLLGQANTMNGTQALACRLDSSLTIISANAYGNFPFQQFYFGSILPNGQFFMYGDNLNHPFIIFSDSLLNTPCSSYPLSMQTQTLATSYITLSITTSQIALNPLSLPLSISMHLISDNILCYSGVGVDEIETLHGITVYPVPATHQVQIQPKKVESKLEVIGVYDVFGQKLSVPFSGTVINTRNLSPGMYFLHLKMDDLLFLERILIAEQD